MDRAELVHETLLRRLAAQDLPTPGPALGALDGPALLSVFRSQCLSRQLDRTSREMQRAGQGYYTIGSSGHEGMAAAAHALRPTDMAFLHYRDAAFQIHRASQVPGQSIARDMLLSFAAASADPISGGRHKVLGSAALSIPPQTSTIASHLPKAVGAAFSLGLARRRPPEHRRLPEDALIVCSFGDASSNHSTAQGAFNAAGWASYQNTPTPILFVCEDNGIGISVRTPKGWVAANFQARPGLRYFHADGLDPEAVAAATAEAAAYVRRQRKPAFLHLEMVRLYGHAGSDVESAYRSRTEIEADEARDPLLMSAARLQQAGAATPEAAAEIYEQIGAECREIAAEVVTRPRLGTAQEVMASLIPPARACRPTNGPDPETRAAALGTADLKAQAEPQAMNRLIGWALTDLMLEHGEIVLAGEDIGAKGGVYGVTQKLQTRFGPDRVIDTLLDEQSILGLAIGLAHNGFTPIPEIQFLAYLHNAEDQIRGEAATLPFFSNGQYANPMVVRIAGLGYQRGFGGHFHNDNSIAVLRDVPGVVIACPSTGEDAALMLRECVRLAREEQRVVVFLEPIALYPMKDLHTPGDGGWLRRYPSPERRIGLGEIGVSGAGTDLAIISYGNGRYLSEQAAELLRAEGVGARLIDLRWLAPLPEEAVLAAIAPCGAALVVDECRRTGGQGEALTALLAERFDGARALVAAEDSFIATGPAYGATLPSRDGIVAAARALVGRRA